MTSGNDKDRNKRFDEGDFDLDDLKSALTRATPRPDAGTKADHLALAAASFDKMQTARQGPAHAPRPTPDRPTRGVFSGVRNMLNALSTKGGLTITTAIVACGFIVLTPQGRDMLNSVPGFGGGQISELDVTPAPVGADVAARDEMPAGADVAPAEIAEPASIPTAPELSDAEVALDGALDSDGPAAPPAIAEAATAPAGDTPAVTELQAIPEAEIAAPALADEADDMGAVIADAPMMDVAPAAQPPAAIVQSDIARIIPAPRPGVPAPTGQQTIDPGLFHAGGGVSPITLDEGAAAPAGVPDTEAFATEEPSPVIVTSEAPVSTFSIDVDTAAYSVIRQSLNAGYLPPPDAVRIEEMINYFPYDYAAPVPWISTPENDPGPYTPFRPTITVMDTPWNDGTQLVHIGLQGEMPLVEDRPPLNLVFLIDTSGSMADPNKLPLLRQSFLMMLDELRPEDEVAIVEYAGSAGVALAPTPAANRATIAAALLRLGAGGATNGQGGLEQAYATAAAMTADGEVSRVILATDGDFNVGLSGIDELEDYIAGQRETGIYLSLLGFGRGNLDDATMQTLAQNGNGVAAYIDTLNEAQKVLVDQLTGALFTIAVDVKVQVEFNPAVVAEYRLIGYETRALEREDFNNDAVDAGELGAGHSVTAIYEITPVGSDAVLNDPLRYAPATAPAGDDAATDGGPSASPEIGYLRLRWKAPGQDDSQLYETPILAGATPTPGTEAQFATAIAGFGQLLRDDSYLGDWGWDEAIALANAGRGEDLFGYRTEAVQLMRLAQSLSGN